MIAKKILIWLFVIKGLDISAQTKIDTAAIRSQLELILKRDQMTRSTGDSAAFMFYFDSCNMAQLKKIVKTYGWPGISFVGENGNAAAFLVVQHADISIQEKYFPLLKRSVEMGESKKGHLALMEDRILMRNDKKQIYGSQLVWDDLTNAWVFYPIEDEKNVNKRRAEVGLEPMEEYAKHFDINYTLPTE